MSSGAFIKDDGLTLVSHSTYTATFSQTELERKENATSEMSLNFTFTQRSFVKKTDKDTLTNFD